MKPEEIGRRFGIGVRVAGRIAKERIDAAPSNNSQPQGKTPDAPAWSSQSTANARVTAKTGRVAGQTARAAGRGVAGFLKPFGRVGGILWLEVTGFFFGLFAVFF